MTIPRIARMLAPLAAFALLVSACGDDATVEPGESTTTAAPSTTEATTTTEGTTPPVVTTLDVGVYFVADVVEPAGGGVVTALVASARTVEIEGDATPGLVAEAALAAVIDGPNDFETEIGHLTTVPSTTKVLGVEVEAGIATVDLSGEFETPSGALTDALRVAQVVFTLTALDDVDSVRFRIDGSLRDVIGSHGVEVDAENGARRDDLPEARPPILVETPVPGAMVSGPVLVSGESNTFEANVRWAITGPNGEILEEGFTTATGGNGTWGLFEVTIPEVTVPYSGLGAVIVWEDSAKDGRQVNIVEVPVEFGAPS